MTEDAFIRATAIQHCLQLSRLYPEGVPWGVIQDGFEFNGERIFLGSTARGIHKPTQMQRGALSIKTIKPKPGFQAPYHDEIIGDDYFRYAFFQRDPNHANNRWLRENWEDQSPLIYFWPITLGIYQILAPCFIHSWDPIACAVEVGVGSVLDLRPTNTTRLAEAPDRRYTTVEAKMRLHQAEFRILVLGAYGRRCAISDFPVVRLLEAAHIVPDRDERGVPTVNNGLCLSNMHHAAYDRDLLGIDPDGVVHLAEEVLAQSDGPVLSQGLQQFHGRQIRLPRDAANQPNREFLAERFEQFRRRTG